MNQLRKNTLVVALLGLLLPWVASTSAQSDPKPASSIPGSYLLQPAVLASQLQNSTQANGKKAPLILQVGFRTLYDQAHIPGAEYAGAAGEDEGLRSLRARTAALPKDTAIVIYCGCCPWGHCPNIGTAFEALQRDGFTRLKVLYIAHDFGTDWVDKGYPSTKGS